ncbi:MAG: EFR1 family ferrodoxin [Lachnospiraceae bacterium]
MVRKIKRVTIVSWSATGNTEKITNYIGKKLSQKLEVPYRSIDFTPLENRQQVMEFKKDELVVVGSPTYAGKLPNKILPDFQSKLLGEDTLAIAVITFGNRNFDNAVAELCDVLDKNKFCLIAAAAFSCRHAFSDNIAATHPTKDDLKMSEEFSKEIIKILSCQIDSKKPLQVDGEADAPYYIPKGIDGKPAKFLKAKPVTDKNLCDKCGVCARVCPMQSIDYEDVSVVSGICIKCQACIRKCPKKAKYFDDIAFLSHIEMLEANFSNKQKENRFWFQE